MIDEVSKIVDEKSDTIIFLGDYIDRGDKSKEVVDYLLELKTKYRCIFLKGNHEKMLLDYIESEGRMLGFLMNGGLMTLMSYGIEDSMTKPDISLFPEEHITFFKETEYYFKHDSFVCVHAGMRPHIDNVINQDEKDLIWIREEFFKAEYSWNPKIIFGHTPTNYLNPEKVFKPYVDEKRNIIGIDTGAVYGGALTCYNYREDDFITIRQ